MSGLAPAIADTRRKGHPMFGGVPKKMRCDSCTRRAALYKHKRTRNTAGSRTGEKLQLCATCMEASWAAFGEGPEDYTRIKWNKD